MEFRLLGPVEVWSGGQKLAVGGSQRLGLLATLLLHANHVVTVNSLLALLWGAEPPKTSRTGLQVRMSQLRALLAEGGPDAGARLAFRPPGYVLRVAAGELDWERFGRLADEGRQAQAAGDPARAADLLSSALALWRGRALENVALPGLAEQSDRLEQRRLAALEDRIEADLQLGRHAGVVDELVALTAAHPLCERVRGQLMLALYRAGRRADALEAFRNARETLVEQLAIEPGQRLQQLHRSILNADPALELTAATVRVRAAAPAVVPAQLPADPAGFAGRTEHLKQLVELLGEEPGSASPAIVISAIEGTAGIGKTALAVYWAHRVRDRFPDGQLYVNLRGFAPSGSILSPAEAVRGFLDALNVPPQRIPAGLDAQIGLYRSILADRRMLLLLDNARDEEQVRPLLPGSRGCLVLVTSRNRLSGLVAAEGARPLRLDVLTAEEAWELLARRLGPDRLSNEPLAVEGIVELCARLPLALAIVAARAALRPEVPLAALAAELRHAGRGLDAFAGTDAATNLRTVLSWSVQALTAEAAQLLRLLGLNQAPDISVVAAASLAGVPVAEARAWLAELVRASLVAEPVPGRYAFHDLLRAYAIEQVEQLETETDRHVAVGRLVDHHVQTAAVVDRLVYPGRKSVVLEDPLPGVQLEPLEDAEQALAWITAGYPALLAAVEQAGAEGFDVPAWDLAWILTIFLDGAGRWQDLAVTQGIALEAARRMGHQPSEARSHRGVGNAMTRLGRTDEARTHLTRAIELFGQTGNQRGQANVHLDLALMYERLGQNAEALHHTEKALELSRLTGDRGTEGRSLNAIGWYHAQLGDYLQTLEYCQQALSLQQEIGDREGEALSWHSLGRAHHLLGHWPEAVRCLQEALEIHRLSGSGYHQARVLAQLGDVHDASGDAGSARREWEAALAIFEELGSAEAAETRAKLDRLA